MPQMGVRIGSLCASNPDIKHSSLPTLSGQYRLSSFWSTKFSKMDHRFKILRAVIPVTL